LACGFAACSALPAAADATGLYMRGNEISFEAIQLVELSEGNLAGRYEHYYVDESGKVHSSSREIEGSIARNSLILNLKGDRSLSGKLERNSLNLIWEGGAGEFRKSDASVRNKTLAELNDLGVQIVWMRKTERAAETYSEALSVVADVETKSETLADWMDTVLSKYDALSEQYKTREKRLETMSAMNVNYDLRYKVENEMYGLENEFYSLEGEVKRKRASLNWDVDSAKRKFAEVMEFCGTLPAKNEPVAFCQELPRETSGFDVLIRDISAEFGRWDKKIQ